MNINIEAVGLSFDDDMENMESSTFILVDSSARAVFADVRCMLETLRHVSYTTRIIEKLKSFRD